MNLNLDVSIPAVTVFLQGFLSFLSPCVLPLLPIYITYLSGGAVTTDENGVKKYQQKKVILHTICFILGISFAFFLLALGFSALGRFFVTNQLLFARIGGILVIILGLIQLDIFKKPFHGKEFKLPLKLNLLRMNPLTALLMGFTFSFAWTPCVGPALSTVLIMISQSKSLPLGILLMGVYTLGFTLPFLLVGFFTTQLLNLFQKYKKVMQYTVKIGGILMILIGLMMLTGFMNGFTNYLSKFTANDPKPTATVTIAPTQTPSKEPTLTPEAKEDTENETVYPASDFELKDQFGNTHKLSDYKGKVVFLNFWATWCSPCRAEMPDIQKLYEEYGLNEKDVIILGVAAPKSETNKDTREKDVDGITQFLEENGYTYPTVMDLNNELGYEYLISAYPTTFMIDVEGNIYGYAPGMLSYDIMEDIIKQTIDSK